MNNQQSVQGLALAQKNNTNWGAGGHLRTNWGTSTWLQQIVLS
jgi:hypothetical protein